MTSVPVDGDALAPDVLDREVLADLLTLGDAVLALLPDHDATFRAGLVELEAAAVTGAAPQVERLAPSLKGSSACMAAQQVAARCAGIQADAARGRCPRPVDLAALHDEHERAVAVLHRVLRSA